eukprot:6249825-Amphidinium_carterae.1
MFSAWKETSNSHAAPTLTSHAGKKHRCDLFLETARAPSQSNPCATCNNCPSTEALVAFVVLGILGREQDS